MRKTEVYRWVYFLVVGFLVFLPGRTSWAEEKNCKTRFPIVFSYHWGGTVEGTWHYDGKTSGRRASFNLGMIEALRDCEAEVRIADKYNYETNSRYETNEYRAQKLAEAIELILEETKPSDWDEKRDGRWKVNLIGHSQGAVDGRYMIAKLHARDGTPMHELVATYTSVSGIHGGSFIADLLLWGRYKLVGDKFYNAFEGCFRSAFGGDIREALSNPGFWPSVESISTSNMDEFNAEIVPIEQTLTDVVYRKSYASIVKSYPVGEWKELGPFWLYNIFHADGGKNDFFITFENQVFGETELVVGESWGNGLHHMAWSTVPMPRQGDSPAWDVDKFYTDLVRQLAQDGF